VLASQPAHAAAKRVAGDAHGARRAGERRKAGLGRRVGHRAPADARAHAGAPRRHVDLDLLQPVGADEEGALEAVDRHRVVTGRLRGDAQATLGGVADGLGHVVGVGYADDGGGLLLMKKVERLGRRAEAVVDVGEDLAVDTGLEFGEAR
jgi:hypothetical protein